MATLPYFTAWVQWGFVRRKVLALARQCSTRAGASGETRATSMCVKCRTMDTGTLIVLTVCAFFLLLLLLCPTLALLTSPCIYVVHDILGAVMFHMLVLNWGRSIVLAICPTRGTRTFLMRAACACPSCVIAYALCCRLRYFFLDFHVLHEMSRA